MFSNYNFDMFHDNIIVWYCYANHLSFKVLNIRNNLFAPLSGKNTAKIKEI